MDRTESAVRWVGVCLDCGDVDELAHFYSTLLGYEVVQSDVGWRQLRPAADAIGPAINLQSEDCYEPPTWPEQDGRQQKMIHFEVEVSNLDAAIETVL